MLGDSGRGRGWICRLGWGCVLKKRKGLSRGLMLLLLLCFLLGCYNNSSGGGDKLGFRICGGSGSGSRRQRRSMSVNRIGDRARLG